MDCETIDLGRNAKRWSCVFKTCSAIWGDEMITTWTDPNFNSMISPYVFDNLYKSWWGILPKRGRFPSNGHMGNGPGGLLNCGWQNHCTKMWKTIMATIASINVVKSTNVINWPHFTKTFAMVCLVNFTTKF